MPQAKLDEVVRILTERKIGAVVVIDDEQKIKGILSERDIVRALARQGRRLSRRAGVRRR